MNNAVRARQTEEVCETFVVPGTGGGNGGGNGGGGGGGNGAAGGLDVDLLVVGALAIGAFLAAGRLGGGNGAPSSTTSTSTSTSRSSTAPRQ